MIVSATARTESLHSAQATARDCRAGSDDGAFSQALESQQTAAETAPAGESVANVFGLVTTHHSTPPEISSNPQTAAAAADSNSPTYAPTAEEVFGPNPWMTAPVGWSAGLGMYSYNPLYFATQQTAEKVAQMLGGAVVASNAMVGDAGPFYQSAPNYMVELPNGHRVNAGLTASYFTHGWSMEQINRMLQCDRNV